MRQENSHYLQLFVEKSAASRVKHLTISFRHYRAGKNSILLRFIYFLAGPFAKLNQNHGHENAIQTHNDFTMAAVCRLAAYVFHR